MVSIRPAQLDSYFEADVYEMHKQAYGVKGRHYDFKNMTDEDLKRIRPSC